MFFHNACGFFWLRRCSCAFRGGLLFLGLLLKIVIDALRSCHSIFGGGYIILSSVFNLRGRIVNNSCLIFLLRSIQLILGPLICSLLKVDLIVFLVFLSSLFLVRIIKENASCLISIQINKVGEIITWQ